MSCGGQREDKAKPGLPTERSTAPPHPGERSTLGRAFSGSERKVIDGAFAETKELVAGLLGLAGEVPGRGNRAGQWLGGVFMSTVIPNRGGGRPSTRGVQRAGEGRRAA